MKFSETKASMSKFAVDAVM